MTASLPDYPVLNFPAFDLRLEGPPGQVGIFDVVRRKFVRLTPEEWVRQHLIHFLIHHRNYPLHLLAVEYSLKWDKLTRRCDVIAFGKGLRPLLIAEVKAPQVPVTQKVLDQVLRYNLPFRAPHLLLSNGLRHFMFSLDGTGGSYAPRQDVPFYQDIREGNP